jgi:hypothetical protein
MARNGRTAEEVRRDLATERDRLASAVDALRREIGEVTDVSGKLGANLPAAAAAAAAVGFVVAGGIGATMRWFARRSREGREEARIGPFSFVRRR